MMAGREPRNDPTHSPTNQLTKNVLIKSVPDYNNLLSPNT